ncbi:hypothetical protein [Pseudoalteromonas rubra]|uniref:hypothetical protein n=1 Tax=Pseudoalteromonas rubra TaxID=43658 RepID=UPI000F79F969|nr:hypothetical protein [Pseudoalteromonas rubra]
MSKNFIDDSLDDFYVDQILSMDESDLEEDFIASGLDQKEELLKFRRAVEVASLPFRKQKLQSARAEVNRENQKHSRTSDAIRRFKSNGIDIREKLAQLIASGQVPTEITMAFRDGKEITDAEIEGILEDLIELGVVKDDKQEDSK